MVGDEWSLSISKCYDRTLHLFSPTKVLYQETTLQAISNTMATLRGKLLVPHKYCKLQENKTLYSKA